LIRGWISWLFLLSLLSHTGRVAAEPTEYEVKAVFLYNFSHFVEWPSPALGATGPFTICVLGTDPFQGQLDDAARGERVDGHPLSVRHIETTEAPEDCRIVFIARSESVRLLQILTVLNRRSVLTVSELDNAAQRGVMIQFINKDNHVRLLINADAAHAAGLVVSSKLLRLAEIIGSNSGAS
jgi:hypothetical protein